VSAKFLDISGRLGKVRNRVYRVGVELEGAWSKLPEDMTIQRDGSVQEFANEVLPNGKRPWQGIGEIPSPVLLPDGKVNDLTLETWIRKAYPQGVNDTCGMHVHMSFRNAFQYAYLMDERLQHTAVEFVKRWAEGKPKVFPKTHVIWKRLEGNHQYCQLRFEADMQAQKLKKEYERHAPGSRYTVMNYALLKTGTIECRLLPMMPDVEIAIEAIRLVMDITSTFLVMAAEEKGVLLDGKVAGRGEKPVSSEWQAGVDSAHRESFVVEI
jgi:hypothetical protein